MITIGTLLWIDERFHPSTNNKNKNIASYYRQLDLLLSTLQREFKVSLVVFTNDSARIADWFIKRKRPLPAFVQISSGIPVPEHTPFYHAHHKLDALKAGVDLLNKDEDRLFLIDIDVIALHPFNSEQLTRISNADLIVYDISDQVFPTYGSGRVTGDIERLAGESFIDAKWFGGEIIGASRSGLLHLIEQCDQIMPRYFENISSFHHVGDEMFITAGINKIIKNGDGLRVVTQNPYRLISRHWSRYTDRPLSYHMQHSFIHCPGSKPALEFLSCFNAPPRRVSYAVLRVYQCLVLAYQFGKKRARRLRSVVRVGWGAGKKGGGFAPLTPHQDRDGPGPA